MPAKTKSSKSKKGATTYDVLMATAVAAIEQIKTLATGNGQSLTKLLAALKEKSAVATKPVMEDDLALLFAEFAPVKAGDVAVDYERQIANTTRLAIVFLAIVRAAKGEAVSAKPPSLSVSATLQEGDGVPTGTMKRYIALKTFLLELRGHLSEEAAAVSKQYRQGANQRFVDAFSVLEHVREELGNLSDALTGKKNATLIEMLEMAQKLKRADPSSIQHAVPAPANGDATKILDDIVEKLGRSDLKGKGRQAVMAYLNQIAMLHLAITSATGKSDVLVALQDALEAVEALK